MVLIYIAAFSQLQTCLQDTQKSGTDLENCAVNVLSSFLKNEN